MALLTLGDLELDGFEVPASVSFGGAQRAAVHKLLGGRRIIDTMGRDDRALVWSGVLSGPTAGDRARAMDAMRAGGATLALSWDAFSYNIVITTLDFDFHNPWWITYRIECTVLIDLAQTDVTLGPDISGSVLGDLSIASAFANVAGVLTALSVPLAISPGAPGIVSALSTLGSVQASISKGIGAAEQGLDTGNLGALVNSSGSLAQLSFAQGFVDRSIGNLSGVLS